ncbi:hypothetical protein LSAT2_014945 [Lamellibrachia satsuma]|nr:hypothetical protein LSAT2_014945 [Lamellibrachia satsuma]
MDLVGGWPRVHATIKVQVGRIITHRQECCQAVRSSETTMNILDISPEAIQDCRDEIDIWNVPAVHGSTQAFHTNLTENIERSTANCSNARNPAQQNSHDQLTAFFLHLSSTAPRRQSSPSTYLPLLPDDSLLPPLVFHCSLSAAFFLHLSSTAPCRQSSPSTYLPLLPVGSLLPPLIFHCSPSTVFSLDLSSTAPCRQPSPSTCLPLLPVGSLLPPLIFHCSLSAAFSLHLSPTAPCQQPSPFTCLPLLPIKMLSGISNFLFGAAEELCGPSDGAADEPRLKTSPAEDEWVLVDKSRGTSPEHMQSSPMEDLLIEHPSMSVYTARGRPGSAGADSELSSDDDSVVNPPEPTAVLAQPVHRPHAVAAHAGLTAHVKAVKIMQAAEKRHADRRIGRKNLERNNKVRDYQANAKRHQRSKKYAIKPSGVCNNRRC